MTARSSVLLSLCLGLVSCTNDDDPLGQSAGGLTGLSPTADNDSAFPGELHAGRMASVAIDPTDAKHVVAVADAGGVYISHDGGATWETSINPDGSVGPYGHGFEGTAINIFFDVAFSPDGKTLLLLAGRSTVNDTGGVWRSTDGGKNWTQPTAPSPSDQVSSPARIAFSPTQHFAYAVCGGQLGISQDDGASFTWSDPFAILGSPLHAALTGLDIFPKSNLVNPFGESAATGGGDVLAFCIMPKLAAQTQRAVLFYNVRNGKTLLQDAPPIDGSLDSGDCQVAFDPHNGLHVFVASHSHKKSNIAEGIVTPGQSGGTTWIDLQGPTSTNGRPVFVQVGRKTEETITVYYHSAASLYQQDCPSTGNCPPGNWKVLPMLHPDASRIAFDAQGRCPLLLTNDGGLEQSSDCGATWTADVSGLHALEPWGASFAGQALEKSLLLDLQDNGTFISRLTDADLQNPQPGEGLSFLPWYGREVGDGYWSEQLRTDPTMAVAATNDTPARVYTDLRSTNPTPTLLPPPPTDGGVLSRGANETPTGAFVRPGIFAMATLDQKTQRLQMWHVNVKTNHFVAVGDPSFPVPNPSTAARVAVAGATADDPKPNIFVIQGGTLWVFNGIGWGVVAGPKLPLEVWTDTVDPTRAYVLDGHDDSMWKPSSGVLVFKKDIGLTQLLANNGQYAGVPHAGCSHQACTVAFDPKDPQKIAVGTAHAGVLFSSDGGASWAKAGKLPEPHGAVIGLYFDSPAGPKGENGLAAIWGQGVWAVGLAAGQVKWPGPQPGKLSGVITGADEAPIAFAQLEVRIVDVQVLEQRYAAAADEETRDDPTAAYQALDEEGDDERPTSFFETVTVPMSLNEPPRFALPPPERNPWPNEVVADYLAPDRTDELGGFDIALPELPPGQYYVQVMFAGDERNAPITAGGEYDVGALR